MSKLNVGDRVIVKPYDEINDHYGIIPEFWDGYVGSVFTVYETGLASDFEEWAILKEDDNELYWPVRALISVSESLKFGDTKYAVRIIDLEPNHRPLGIPQRDLTYVEDTIEEAITRGKEYIKEEDGRYMVKIYEFRQLREWE